MELPIRRAGRPANEQRKKEVIRLNLKGLKDAEIAGLQGVTRTRVWQIIKQYRDGIELSPTE